MLTAEGQGVIAPAPGAGSRVRESRAEDGDPSARPWLSVIIPCFNEEQRLPATLADVLDYLARQPYTAEVVVVDDGSTDDTVGVACSFRSPETPIRVESYAPNRGKGHAVRRGMIEARGAVRLFMDADNSTKLESIESFWPHFDDGADVVIGSRAADGARVEVHQAWYKEAAGRIGNFLIRALAVPGIRDTQCGFKAFTARAAREVFARMVVDGFGFDVEALALSHRRGFAVREVPVRWRNHADSKVRAGDYLRVLGTVAGVRWRLLRGRHARVETLAARP